LNVARYNFVGAQMIFFFKKKVTVNTLVLCLTFPDVGDSGIFGYQNIAVLEEFVRRDAIIKSNVRNDPCDEIN
jgi:hypothetical protein